MIEFKQYTSITRPRRIYALMISLCVGSLALSACSGGDTSGGSTAGDSTQAGSDSAELAAAEAVVKKASARATWAGPTEPVQPPEDKVVSILSCPLSFSGCQTLVEEHKAAAKLLGWKVNVLNVLDPSKLGAFLATAIQQKPDVIVDVGFGPCAVLPERLLDEMEAKNIYFVEQTANMPDCTAADQNWDYKMIGETLAAQMMLDTDGKANVLNITSEEFFSGHAGNDAMVAYLEANCPGCNVTDLQWVTADSADGSLGPKVVAAVRANPDLNSVYIPFDNLGTLILPALKNAGVADKLKAYSALGEELQLKQLAEGDVMAADIATPVPWASWALMDSMVRLTAGQEPQPGNVPQKLLTESTAPADGQWDYDGVDFRGEYKALWGLGAN